MNKHVRKDEIDDDQRRYDQTYGNWKWRLNNLYKILDERGREVDFRLNDAQVLLFDNLHYLNVILKARQRGFTTAIQIFMMDQCVFKDHIRAGTIAHTLADAQVIFREKVKFPYDSLPSYVKEGKRSIKSDNTTEMMLRNNSSLRIGVSLRSGTLQFLHVSEYGKICAQAPKKATEVRTGALNTIASGQFGFIESTAEGEEGHFFEICETAQEQARRRLAGFGGKETPLDWRFHFAPWWTSPLYTLDPEDVEIPENFLKYFDEIENKLNDHKNEHWIRSLEIKERVKISPKHRAWYVKKSLTQKEEMKREYPSTPEEAFAASVSGAYYGEAMAQVELEGRIGEFPVIPSLPVHTVWDIGRRDYNPIWFFQLPVGKIRLVNFHQAAGKGMPYYAAYVHDLYTKNKWVYGQHLFPHDAKVIEWGSDKSRIEQLIARDINPTMCLLLDVHDGINAVRAILPACEFDAEGCKEGIQMLKTYGRRWSDDLGKFVDEPRHNIASHGADAFRGLASTYRDIQAVPIVTPNEKELVLKVNEKTGLLESNMSIFEIVMQRMKGDD